MSRHSYAGEESSSSSPKSTSFISSFLNKLPVSFRKKGSGHDAVRRLEDDYRSLPPSRSSNHSHGDDKENRSGLPDVEGDAFDRPNLTASISEPNGFISEFSPYRRRVFDDESVSSGLSLNGAYLNDGTLYYPKTVSPVALELTALDGSDDGPPRPLHYFLVVQLHHLTWCDVCGELIWGLVYQCLRCSYCRFTCHHHCRHLVDVDCHRRDVVGDESSSSTSSTTVSPTNSDESPPSSSADSLPSSTGYSSAADESVSADSSIASSAAASVADEGVDDGELGQLRQKQPVFPSKKGKKTKGSRKIRPKLSNDLFSPTRGIFDDYDDSSGDSGHVIGSERELFGGEGGDGGGGDNFVEADPEFFEECVETVILEVEEAENEAPFPPPASAWEPRKDYLGDERVEYVGPGGEIWMEGEKCDSCDDDHDSGMSGYVTAKRDVATVKPAVIKQCQHQGQQLHHGKHDKSGKGVKNGESSKRDNAFTKGSSHQSKRKTTSKTSNSAHPSKTEESASLSRRHHRHQNRQQQQPSRQVAADKTRILPPSNAPPVTAAPRQSAHPERSSLLPGGQTLNKRNLASLVKEFNKRSKGLNLNILEDDVTVRGFIRVHLDLMRPVNISSDRRLSLSTGAGRDSTGKSSSASSERTTFHIPQDTVKNLHVTSDTTVKEVVEALLKKYAVTDHPKKFALFEKTLHISDDGKHAVSSRRLHDFECPLLIFLCWGGEMLDQRKFVLQENETGEILWEAFSLPELHTFLRILDHEEKEYEREVCEKYRLYQLRLLEEISKHEKSQGFSDC